MPRKIPKKVVTREPVEESGESPLDHPASCSQGNNDPETSSKKRKTDNFKARKFVLTIHNYTDDLILRLDHLTHKSSAYVYGYEECPKTFTKHLQVYLRFENSVSRDQLKKDLQWDGYCVKANGSDVQNLMYCTKDLTEKYKSNIKIPKIPEPLDIIENLKPWQSELLELVSGSAKHRKIIWCYEGVGGVGKSVFAKFLCVTRDAIFIDEGSKRDLVNVIFNKKDIDSRSIVVLDIPRSNGNKCSYKAIESIKNGLLCNTKYETGMMYFNNPHILIFSNFFPELNGLSLDKWMIFEIHDNELCYIDRKEDPLDM